MNQSTEINMATSRAVTGMGASTGRTETSPAPGRLDEPTLDRVTVRLEKCISGIGKG